MSNSRNFKNKNIWSVNSDVMCNNILFLQNTEKNEHTYLKNAAKTFKNCTYSKINVFSFGVKCIQSGIQYVFSSYSVLGSNVFSQVFSFRGGCIQFCE